MRLLLAGLCLASFAGQLKAAAGAAFLTDEYSTRARGAGGAAAAADLGAEGLRYNPAGLSGLAGPEAYFAHFSAYSAWDHDALALGLPLGPGVLGMEVLSGRLAPIPVYDMNEIQVGSVGADHLVGSLAWAQKFFGGSSLGIAAKGFTSRIGGYSNSGYAVDLGVRSAQLWRALRLGLSLNNLGAQNAYVSVPDPLPLGWRLGFAWRAPGERFLDVELRGDYRYFPEAVWMPPFVAGLELGFRGSAYASVGLQAGGSGGRVLASYGGGVRFSLVSLAYSYVPDDLASASHLFSLTLRGLPRSAKDLPSNQAPVGRSLETPPQPDLDSPPRDQAPAADSLSGSVAAAAGPGNKPVPPTYVYQLLSEGYLRAESLEAQGLSDQAVKAYTETLAANPDDRASWRALAKLYARLGYADYAHDCWRQVLRLDPTDLEAAATLGPGRRR